MRLYNILIRSIFTIIVIHNTIKVGHTSDQFEGDYTGGKKTGYTGGSTPYNPSGISSLEQLTEPEDPSKYLIRYMRQLMDATEPLRNNLIIEYFIFGRPETLKFSKMPNSDQASTLNLKLITLSQIFTNHQQSLIDLDRYLSKKGSENYVNSQTSSPEDLLTQFSEASTWLENQIPTIINNHILNEMASSPMVESYLEKVKKEITGINTLINECFQLLK